VDGIVIPGRNPGVLAQGDDGTGEVAADEGLQNVIAAQSR
jgi:hypothetical protein